MKVWFYKTFTTCMILFFPCCLVAQFTKLAPSSCDTLTFDSLKIPRLTYVWDGEYENYERIDTLQNPHIVEVLYGNNTIRDRIFIQKDRTLWGWFSREGLLWQVGFSFYYKGEKFVFSGDEYDMMAQTEKGKILAEFTKIPKHKQVLPPKKKWKYWRLHPRHGKPVKYARKLLRIYKSQYEEVFYHIKNCDWYERKDLKIPPKSRGI